MSDPSVCDGSLCLPSPSPLPPFPMLAPERHRAILRLLSERGRLTLAEVESRFGVSSATARRDADDLALAGKVQRTHGGLLPPDFSLSEPVYLSKATKAAGLKAALGRVAAALLPEAGTVFIDAGTTCLEVARAVLDRPSLRIYTNSVPLLMLAPDARASIAALGGEVRKLSLALTGALAQSWLEQLRFDAAVVGASGLDHASGACTTELAEAAAKAEALRRARLRVLVAHSGKWARPATVRFAPWPAFHHFVTDGIPGRADRAALSLAGVKLHLVSPS